MSILPLNFQIHTPTLSIQLCPFFLLTHQIHVVLPRYWMYGLPLKRGQHASDNTFLDNAFNLNGITSLLPLFLPSVLQPPFLEHLPCCPHSRVDSFSFPYICYIDMCVCPNIYKYNFLGPFLFYICTHHTHTLLNILTHTYSLKADHRELDNQ